MPDEHAVRRPPRIAPPPRRGGTTIDQGQFPWTVVGVVVTAATMCYYAWLWVIDGERVGAALVLVPILALFTVPAMVRAARTERDFDLPGLLLTGLGLRFFFAHYRFTHAFDANVYHSWGVYLARSYRRLDFGVDPGQQVPGTGGLRIISGVVHVLVNNDMFASFLVMAWLGFWGCWFLYRAAITTVPDLKRYRYARLVFLWPSLAFWPSSLGKDAWMLFTIGLASYGAARVFRRLTGGYTLLMGGLFLGSFVRPHLALVALFAFGCALMIGRRPTARDRLTPSSVAKVAALVVLLALGSVLITRTEKLLNVDDLASASSVQAGLTLAGERSETGGSSFDAPDPLSVTGFPVAVATVLFRPLPTEADTTEQVVVAAEGLFLVVLTIVSWRGVLSVLRRLRTQPYVTYAAIYVALWAMVFGVIANFGILARQRTQMLPFFFVVVCLPALGSTVGRAHHRHRTVEH